LLFPNTHSLFIGDNDPSDRNTIVFEIDIHCKRRQGVSKDATEPEDLYDNHELLSRDLIWKPAGEQDTVFADKAPAPTNSDIVLAKLRPGQSIKMELHAIKGVGKDHAKFSPVGTWFPGYGPTLYETHGSEWLANYA
jgi:DNA-directed RNA polymerases I and III subunit RPAC1